MANQIPLNLGGQCCSVPYSNAPTCVNQARHGCVPKRSTHGPVHRSTPGTHSSGKSRAFAEIAPLPHQKLHSQPCNYSATAPFLHTPYFGVSSDGEGQAIRLPSIHCADSTGRYSHLPLHLNAPPEPQRHHGRAQHESQRERDARRAVIAAEATRMPMRTVWSVYCVPRHSPLRPETSKS
jgi:hypothetical protein